MENAHIFGSYTSWAGAVMRKRRLSFFLSGNRCLRDEKGNEARERRPVKEGSMKKMIHIVSIACLIASRMWLGSDSCSHLWVRGSLLLFLWSLWVVVFSLSFLFFSSRKQTSALLFFWDIPRKVLACVALHTVPQQAVTCAPHCTSVTLLCSSDLPWSRAPCCPVLLLFLDQSCWNPQQENSEGANAHKAVELSVHHCKVTCGVEKLHVDAASVCCPRRHCYLIELLLTCQQNVIEL